MDANSPPYFAAQEVDKIVGPQILTVLLNSGLLGVLSVQVYLYYLAFPNDRSYMKCLVYGIYFLEFVQSVFIVEAGFQTFVNGFGDFEVLNQIKTQWLSIPVLTAIGESSL
ncbi:hypothetical protein M413DRAFT_21944 [Hebeloma cylindrosporum]|uniref:Uncharacterized protein n=1 Tax=Hebeloma cylindrosporum TaxID=76867 RepID=A0A0C3D107_HEBCY|nr:hypothetical protein M413DRAFT_21944 [Hebeloma cylindrosporum h7]